MGFFCPWLSIGRVCFALSGDYVIVTVLPWLRLYWCDVGSWASSSSYVLSVQVVVRVSIFVRGVGAGLFLVM